MNKSQIYLFCVLMVGHANLYAQIKSPEKMSGMLGEQNGSLRISGTPRYSVLNINNLSTWHRSDGHSNHSPAANNGVLYPYGTGGVIYQDCLVWGGKVYTNASHTAGPGVNPLGNSSQPVRVGGGTYGIGTRAGKVNGFGSQAVAQDPNASTVRVYRIRRDYYHLSEADLRRDAASYYETSESSVTVSQMDAVVAQYALDWADWPVADGAPYIERNGSPGYQSPPAFGPAFSADDLISQQYDEPGVAGANPRTPADQVLWMVYNDLNPLDAVNFEGSSPLGVEVQKTVWGYDRSDALGNVYFSRYRFVNKGGVDTSSVIGDQLGSFWIDSMYVCQWSDPDLGAYADDLVGCDTTLSLGYVYNSSAVDATYQIYSLPPPAAGYDFLAGPVVPSPGDSAVFDLERRYGWRNLGMSSFAYFSAGSPYSDPPGGASNYLAGAGRWWKMLRGFAPTGDFTSADLPYNYPPAVGPSRFPLSGDPVAGSGWLDGTGDSWSFVTGDRRILLNTGPFSLAPGDTQEIVIGFVVGLGADRLSSISVMKSYDNIVQLMYNTLFDLPTMPTVEYELSFPTSSDVTIRFTASDAEAAFTSMQATLTLPSGTVVGTFDLVDDGAHQDGAAADGVFGGSVTIARQMEPLTYAIVLESLAGLTFTLDGPEYLVTAGDVTVSEVAIFLDNTGADGLVSPGEYIRFGLSIHNATAFALSGITVRSEAASGVVSVPTLSAGSVYAMPVSDTAFLALTVPVSLESNTYSVGITIADQLGNSWQHPVDIPIHQFTSGDGRWEAPLGPFGGYPSVMLEDSAGYVYAFNFVGGYRLDPGSSTWTRIGGNDLFYIYTGHVLSNGDILLVSFRGLFRSSDHGDSWEFTDLDASRTSFRLANGDILLVRSTGIFRSTDEGSTWTPYGSGPLGMVLSRLATTGQGVMLGTGARGVFRSTDMGVTWEYPGSLEDKNSRSLLAVTGNVYLYGTDSLLYRTTNAGTSWTSVTPSLTYQSYDNLFRSSLGVVSTSALNDTIVYESTDNGLTWSGRSAEFNTSHVLLTAGNGTLFGENKGVVVRSTDAGNTWVRIIEGMNGLTITSLQHRGSSIVMGSNRGVFISLDGGTTWAERTSGLPGGSYAVYCTPEQDIFAWTGSRLFKSVDAGASWQFQKTFSSNVSTVLSPTTGTILAGLAYYGEIQRSTNGGSTWTGVAISNLPGYTIRGFHAFDGSTIIASSDYYGMLRSTNGGLTWVGQSDGGADFTGYAEAAGGMVYAVGPLLFRTDDSGNTWSLQDLSGLAGQATSLAVSSDGTVVVGTQPLTGFNAGSGSGVFVLEPGGTVYRNLSYGIGRGPRPDISSLLIDDEGYILTGTEYEGLYRSKTTTGVRTGEEDLPRSFNLRQNYPNPFNPSTTIEFDLPASGVVTLEVFDMLGRNVRTLLNAERTHGRHRIEWDGRTSSGSMVSSGLYFYRLKIGSAAVTKKMLLVR